jgi:hypothetical protein
MDVAALERYVLGTTRGLPLFQPPYYPSLQVVQCT